MGIVQEEIPVRGPIPQGEFLEIERMIQKFIQVNPLNLKNPLGIQHIHLIGIKGRGITKTVHMGNLRM